MKPIYILNGTDVMTWSDNMGRYVFVCSIATIPYKYRAFTGKVLADSQVDTYNRLSDEIKQRALSGFPITDWRIDERHRFFNMAATVTH